MENKTETQNPEYKTLLLLEDVKQEIISNIKSINREGVDKLLAWLLKSDYFTAPSSKDKHSAFEGGLALHSHLVYGLLKDKCEYWKIRKPDLIIPDDDSLKIIAYCHDLCKCNFYTKVTKPVKNGTKVNGYGKTVANWIDKEVYDIDDKFPLSHSYKSIIILQNFIKLTTTEILGIAHHMSIMGSANYGDIQAFNKALEMNKFILLVHTADFESSVLLEEK